MKLRFTTRLWLAWQVLRGTLMQVSYDSRDDVSRIEFMGPAGIEAARRAWGQR